VTRSALTSDGAARVGGTCGPTGTTRGGWGPGRGFCVSGSVLEAPTFVAGLDDLAMMGEPVEECRGHLGVAEDGGPFAEGEIGGDDHRGLLVEPADQVEQELATGLSEGQIAEFVEDDEVHAGEVIGDTAGPPGASFGLELVDEVDDVEEAAASARSDAGSGDGDGEMGLAGAGAADQDDVALMGEEVAAGEVAHQGLIDRRIVEDEVVDIFGEWQLGDGDLVLDRPSLLLGDLGGKQVADEALRLVLAFDRVAMISSKAAFMP
jgi:hypothetical protein